MEERYNMGGSRTHNNKMRKERCFNCQSPEVNAFAYYYIPFIPILVADKEITCFSKKVC